MKTRIISTATEHERNCLHPQKSGYEVMAALEAHDVMIKEEKKMFNTLIDLLSYEKIIFNGKAGGPICSDAGFKRHKIHYCIETLLKIDIF